MAILAPASTVNDAQSLKKKLANCVSLPVGLHYCCSKVRFMNIQMICSIEVQAELKKDVREPAVMERWSCMSGLHGAYQFYSHIYPVKWSCWLLRLSCIRQGVMGNVRPKEDKGGMAGRIGPDQHGPSSPSVIRVDPGLCIRA